MATKITIFEMAQGLVERNPQWGEARSVFKSTKGEIYVAPYNETLQMIFQTSILKPPIIVGIATLNPMSGWMWTLAQSEYENWVSQCKSGKRTYKTVYGGGIPRYPDSSRNGKVWR